MHNPHPQRRGACVGFRTRSLENNPRPEGPAHARSSRVESSRAEPPLVRVLARHIGIVAQVKAVFLDRDGTINYPAPPGEFITSPSELQLLGGADDAIALLRATGHLCIVVSNQRGVALGVLSERDLAVVDARLRELVEIDASYYCIHGLDEDCACRKPRPGLLIQAADDFRVDLTHAWMVGDSESDIEAGRNVGCRTIKVAPEDGALLAAARQIASHWSGRAGAC